MKVIFDHKEDVSEHIATFYFRSLRPVRYTAGQFVELYLPHTDKDDRGHKRWFTLSSSPTEPLLAITTKFVSGGSTFKRHLQHLEPGCEVLMTDPMGDFVLPKDQTIPLVYIAIGLGITPVRSMVTWLVHANQKRSIRMLYAAHTASEHVFKGLLKASVTEYKAVSGRLTIDSALEFIGRDSQSLIYISGPEELVEMLYKILPQKGIAQDRIVGDYFPGYNADTQLSSERE